MMPVINIRRLHYISGLTITIFVGFHLFNHLISLIDVKSHIDVMNTLRVFYRNIFVETILLLAVLIQVVSGLKLFFSTRKSRKIGFMKLQIWSGLYLAFFFMMHVGAVLMGRFYLGLDTNFYFGVAGLNTFPLNLFFVPYYGLAILAFFGHISAIHFMKMRKELLGISVRNQSKLILVIGAIVTLLIFYGTTNGFTGVEIPEAYDVMLGK